MAISWWKLIKYLQFKYDFRKSVDKKQSDTSEN